MTVYAGTAWGSSAWGGSAPAAASASAGATLTTTWAAIRAQMAATLADETLDVLTAIPLRLSEHETTEFREWAEDNAGAAMRRYEIEDDETEILSLDNFQTQLRRTSCELVVAYPKQWGYYRSQVAPNKRAEATMRAVMESDANIITRAIGVRGSANYLGGQHGAIEGSITTEDADGVVFCVIPFDCFYYFNAS